MAEFFNRKNLFFIFVVFLFTFVAYGRTVNYGFVWDDVPLFLNNPYIRLPFSHIFDAFIPGFVTEYIYTPVTFMIKFVLFKIFGASPAPYHIFNFIFYLLTLVLLYRFFLLTLKKQEIAFLSTFLFAVHPAHSEIVSWNSCDGYILSMFFMMIAFNLFVNLLFKDCNLSEKIFNLVFMVLSYIISFLSQPMSVVFPALVLVYTFIFCREKMFFSFKLSLPLFALSLLCIYLSLIGVGDFRYGVQHSLPFQDKLVVLSQYLIKSIFPFEVMPIYPLASEYSFSILSVIAYILLLAVSVFLFVKINNRVYRFFILWFAVSISPYSHLFNHSSTMISDRYLYLPSVSSSMFLAYLLYYISDWLRKIDYIKNRPLISYGAIVGVLVFYTSFSFVCSSVWKNNFLFWNYAYSRNKTNKTILFNLALVYQEANRFEESLLFCDELLKIDSGDPVFHIRRARVLERLGRYDEALVSCRNGLNSYTTAEVKGPLKYGVCQDLIRYYFSKKDYEKAWESAVIMTEMAKTTLDDNSVKASVFRQAGIVSYYYGKIDDFVKYYSEGIFLLENLYPEILVKAVFSHKSGRYEEAINQYRQFLKMSENSVPDIQKLIHAACLSLRYSSSGKERAESFLRQSIVMMDEAVVLLENKNFDKAESLMKKVLSNDPYFLEANKMLGKFYLERGETAKSVYYLQTALQQDPADPELKSLSVKLHKLQK